MGGPPGAAAESPAESPDHAPTDDSPLLSPDRAPLSPTLSFTNADIYEALDEDWLTATETGELSLFAFLDNFNVLPETLHRLNQRLKRESREVPRVVRAKPPLTLGQLRAKLKNRIPSQVRSERITKLDQNIDKLRRTVTKSLTTLQVTWNDGKNVSTRDKIAFVSAVGNIFFTALLLGMAPEKLPIWYTGQMIYYMPLRYFSYKSRGYHYFIADLCYWVNLMVFGLWGSLLTGSWCCFCGYFHIQISS
jgi:hypothetical protein